MHVIVISSDCFEQSLYYTNNYEMCILKYTYFEYYIMCIPQILYCGTEVCFDMGAGIWHVGSDAV